MKSTAEATLRRELNLLDALMVNVGTILGSAIFLVPATVLASAETPLMSSLVWIVAGLVSWCGAVSLAELGVLYPRAGGAYVYLEEAYHPLVGFMYGWTVFAVIQTAASAAVAVALMTYVGHFVEVSDMLLKGGAIALILGLSVWNCFGLRTSANTQNTTTILKLLMVLGLAGACFAFGERGAGALEGTLSEGWSLSYLSGLGTAMVACIWAYDGWISITYVGGEVKEPQRLLPWSLSFSVLFLIGLYVLINLAYVWALPLPEMAGSERVAADAARAVLGDGGGALVALAVIVSCFAAVNGFLFTGARVYYAMALDRVFFPALARLHPRTRAPVNSLLAQGVWASLIALTGTYDQLFTYVVFTSWLFYGMGAAAVVVLRVRRPGLKRDYRVWGYPLVPLFFAGSAAALIVHTLLTNPRDALIGAGIMALGFPLYFYWKERSPAGPE